MKNKWIRIVSGILAVLLTAVAAACSNGNTETVGTSSATSDTAVIDPDAYPVQTVEKPIDRSGQNMRIGAYLWYGFNGVSGMTQRHIDEFYDYREPLWGYGYNDVEDMEFQIQLAYDYGLDFFAYDYYSAVMDAYSSQPIDDFLKARNCNLLDFCLLVINADDNTTPGPDSWDAACEKFIYYMTRDNALKIDGKPVIIFYVPINMANAFGSASALKSAFDLLEQRMIDKGYPGIVILACDGPEGMNSVKVKTDNNSAKTFANRLKQYEACGFDGFTAYNYIIFDQINGKYESTYEVFTDHFEQCWDCFSDFTSSKYAPCLLGGWDDRPRETEIAGVAPYAAGRTKEQFCKHIRNAYDWIVSNPDNALSNLGFIYAWDEIDEGGYIIPTKGEGFEMLEGLKMAADQINGR